MKLVVDADVAVGRMTVTFVPLDAGNEFQPGRLDEILGHLEQALAEVGPPIRAERVDVVVVPGTDVIPGWDINGFSHSGSRITLTIDPNCTGREKRSLAQQLRAVLAHELHHSVRSRGPGYGRTLGEALVSEGLAQCYEEEVGCPTPNYAVAVQGTELDKLAARAIGELSAPHYDHRTWFFGSRNDPEFPWSGGYSLGYALVNAWLGSQRLAASDAVLVDSSAVLPKAFDLLGKNISAV
jgi:hypothetical protein